MDRKTITVANQEINDPKLILMLLTGLMQYVDNTTDYEFIENIINKQTNNYLDDNYNEIVRLIEKHQIDMAEIIIDYNVFDYSKFNKFYPMEYITYNKTEEMWIVMDNLPVKIGPLYDAIEYAFLVMCEKRDIKIEDLITDEDLDKSYFELNGKLYMSYINNNDIWFDIKQVISAYDLTENERQKLYTDNVKNISAIMKSRNIYGGLFIRDLINRRQFNLLINEIDKIISNKFVDELSNILATIKQKQNTKAISDDNDKEILELRKEIADKNAAIDTLKLQLEQKNIEINTLQTKVSKQNKILNSISNTLNTYPIR
jgi:hypothetical protein